MGMKSKIHKWDSFTIGSIDRGIRCGIHKCLGIEIPEISTKGTRLTELLTSANWEKVTCERCLLSYHKNKEKRNAHSKARYM